MRQHLRLLLGSWLGLTVVRRDARSIVECVHARIGSVVDAACSCRQPLALHGSVARRGHDSLVLLAEVIAVQQELRALRRLLSLHLPMLRRLRACLLIVANRLLQLRGPYLFALRQTRALDFHLLINGTS